MATKNQKMSLCKIHSSKTKKREIESFCLECETPTCGNCHEFKHKGHKNIPIRDAVMKFHDDINNVEKEIKESKLQCQRKQDDLQSLQEKIAKQEKNSIEQCEEWGKQMIAKINDIVKKNTDRIKENAETQNEKLKKLADEQNDTIQHIECKEEEIRNSHTMSIGIVEKRKQVLANLDCCFDPQASIKYTIKEPIVEQNAEENVLQNMPALLQVEFQEKTEEAGILHLDETNPLIPTPVAEFVMGTGIASLAMEGEDLYAVGQQEIEIWSMNGNKKGIVPCNDLKFCHDVAIFNQELYVTNVGGEQGIQGQVIVMNVFGHIKNKINLPALEDENRKEIGLTIDKDKKLIYICIAGNNKVYRCSLEGYRLQEFVTRDLDWPMYICMAHNNEIVVTNCKSNNVCKYNSDGELLWSYGGDNELEKPLSVCTDPWDRVFVAAYANNSIVILHANGKLHSRAVQKEFTAPCAMTLKNDSLIVTIDKGDTTIMKCNYKYTCTETTHKGIII